MPKILVQQPRWLDRGTTGFDFFQPQNEKKDSTQTGPELSGPSRKVALRGSEVFAIVGGELRWSDLETWKESSTGAEHADQQSGHAYKVRRPNVVGETDKDNQAYMKSDRY
jgi:nucleoporin NUP82